MLTLDLNIDPDLMPAPAQSRSRETQQRLLDAGWRLLRKKSWDEISVADIAKTAGRSVGVFYQRFRSREDYLSVLLAEWVESGYRVLDRMAEETPDDRLVDTFVSGALATITENNNLWRAALYRSFNEPDTREPFQALMDHRLKLFIQRVEKAKRKKLTAKERKQIAVAFQMSNSFINQALLLDPGPARITDKEFLEVINTLFRRACAFDLP
ncbi:MAG: TetR/AcrR family transcriptional regulator [Parvularculaceae bacterium]